jgi:uncharacterized membrane protein
MEHKRLEGLDIFRGFAIVLMIIYHFIYDLVDFGLLELKMNSNLAVLIFRYIIISMFLFTVGISLALAHKKSVNYASLKKRILFLGFGAALVSGTTYILFPQHWIYFGILHFILVTSLITIPLLKYPLLSLLLVPIIFIGWITDYLHFTFLYELLQEPLNLPQYFSLDRIPLFPWWAVVLLGTLLVHYNLHNKVFQVTLFSYKTSLHLLLKKMGKHALLIYLIHQPIILLGFQVYFILFSK